MPILNVSWIGDQPVPSHLAQRLADAAGGVLQTPPGRTWVMIRAVPSNFYAENHCPDVGAEGMLWISILLSEPPEGKALQPLVETLTAALAEASGVPSTRVHLLFEPAARARIAFGGTVFE